MSSVLAEMKVRSPAVEPNLCYLQCGRSGESYRDRYDDPHVHQNNFSNSNLTPKSPRSSSRSNDETIQKSAYSGPETNA
jgi:hypothetical protein